MLFCVKTPINKLYVFGLALLLAVTLAGCSGSKDTKAEMPDPPIVMPDLGPTPEEIAAMTAAALTKAEAINQEALGSATLPFHSAAIDENYTVTAERQDGAVTVKIAIPGAAMDDPEFMRADALPAIEGWDGSMYTLGPNDDGETEIVGVYTDIAASKPTDFGSVYTLNVSTNTDNDDPQVTNEALRVTTANLSKIMSAGFSAPSEAVAVLTFYEDDAGTENIDEAAEVMGTYDSLPGTYRCAESPVCTVTHRRRRGINRDFQRMGFHSRPRPHGRCPGRRLPLLRLLGEEDGKRRRNHLQRGADLRGCKGNRCVSQGRYAASQGQRELRRRRRGCVREEFVSLRR